MTRTRALMCLVIAGLIAVALPSSARADVTLKTRIGGVIDRQGAPTASYRSTVNGWVVQANWADLQPTAGGPIASNNVIDQAIASARSLNASHAGLNMRLKLRVYAGDEAPNWAKNLDGPPINICLRRGSSCGTVGRFWTPKFGAAYLDLQTKLAALYDAADVVREVAIDRCTTLSAEPLLRQINDAANLKAYRAAGYTLDADEQCQHEQIDAHLVWSSTRSSFAFDPYTAVTSNSTHIDEAFTESLMDYCRTTLGSRCVIGNNGLRDTAQDSDYSAMYNAIKARGGPIYFQTATYSRLGSLTKTLSVAAGYGAGMVELPVGYKKVSPAQLTPSDSQLEAAAASS